MITMTQQVQEMSSDPAPTRSIGDALRSLLNRMVRTSAFWVLVAEAICLAVFAVATPSGNFLSRDNLFSMGVNSSQLLLLAVGTTFVLAAGQLDLSIGSIAVLASVVSAKVILAVSGGGPGVPRADYEAVPLAILLGVATGFAVGIGFGLFNAWIVTKLGVNSFIATLATLGIGMGAALLLTSGSNVAYLPPEVQTALGTRKILGVPAPLILSVIVAVVGWLVLRKTRFGLRTIAIGSSESATRRAGISTRSHITKIFVVSGLLASVAGLLDLSLYGTTALAGHTTDNLSAIAAVVIGGTSLFGGFATMGGTIVASFLPILLINGLVFLSVDSYYQQILIGVVLIAAIYLDQRRRASQLT